MGRADTARGERASRGEWSPDVRSLAYQTWQYRAGRDLTRTATMLAADLPDRSPDVRTLQRWRDADGWLAQAMADLRTVAPLVAVAGAGDLLHAGADAVAYLRDVAAGRIAGDGPRVAAAAALLRSSGLPAAAAALASQAAALSLTAPAPVAAPLPDRDYSAVRAALLPPDVATLPALAADDARDGTIPDDPNAAKPA